MAQRELEAAVERGGQSAGLLDDLGTVLDQRGDAKKAVVFYTKALEVAPAPANPALPLALAGRIERLTSSPCHVRVGRPPE